MKTILILLLGFTAFAQSKVEKKVLYRGSSYNFVFEQMTETNAKGVFVAKYFYFVSSESKNSNGLLNIQIDSIELLKEFVAEIRFFASTINDNGFYDRYLQFEIIRAKNSTEIVLTDCRLGWIKMSTTSAKRLCTEIENNIYLMN